MLNPLVRAPRATDLTVPVGTLMRPTLFVETGDSLSRGAQTLRENGGCLLPVVDENGALRGILTDAGLARALAEMTEATDAVADFLEVPQTLPPYAAAAEALRRGEDGATLVVVDDARRPVGLVSASDLWPRRRRLPRPAMVGGMATPFGVYLTSGNASAGAPWWALAATGASMFGMLVVGAVAADQASRIGLPASWSGALAIVLFLAFMRLSPLSGTHGAEHQVVHAIEREEALVESVVSRMPRVHPRCGTNLMAGLAVFFGMREVFAHVPGLAEAGWVLSFIVAMAFAMPLGAVAQRYVTTKTPTPKQLRGAIAAGEALLLANATARHSKATPLGRIVSAGVLQVMAGAVAAIGLVALLKALTRWSWLPDLS